MSNLKSFTIESNYSFKLLDEIVKDIRRIGVSAGFGVGCIRLLATDEDIIKVKQYLDSRGCNDPQRLRIDKGYHVSHSASAMQLGYRLRRK